MKKKIVKIILPMFAIFSIYLILDYFNIPMLLGISIPSINVELFGIIFNTLIVLVLYVISFYYIENRQNEKDKNARDIVKVLLKKTYEECLSNLMFLDDRTMIAEYIIPKIDGNKTDSENKVVNNLQTLPFASFDSVMSLAIGGYIEEKLLSDYLDIKKDYHYVVSAKITFFDLVDPKTAEQKSMYDNIRAHDTTLKKKLRKLLQDIN